MNQSCNCKIITGQYSLADDTHRHILTGNSLPH